MCLLQKGIFHLVTYIEDTSFKYKVIHIFCGIKNIVLWICFTYFFQNIENFTVGTLSVRFYIQCGCSLMLIGFVKMMRTDNKYI